MARVTHWGDGSSALEVEISDADPARISLLPGQKSLLQLPRVVGDAKALPYMLGFERSERNGTTHEVLTWQPVYRAEGKLKIAACEVAVYVLDYNGDGQFDAADSNSATTLGLDLNGDGKLWGAAEYNKMGQIVEVCGTALEVSELSPSGNSVAFKHSQNRRLKIGDTLPEFQLLTTDRRVLRSPDFRHTVYVFDFWASWCAPCVEKLTHLDRLATTLGTAVTVIGVNVDDGDRRSLVETLITTKQLRFPQVIRGLGDEDYVWKMFGSMQGAHLFIPLYVVIDRKGRISYAAGGGVELHELEAAIKRAVAEN